MIVTLTSETLEQQVADGLSDTVLACLVDMQDGRMDCSFLCK